MSQGIIRLKKVKVAPKRNLSIMKNSVYKKQLSVRFEEQRPLDAIKHLSQDIDHISNLIDSHFPLITLNPYQNVPKPLDLKRSSKLPIFPNESSSEYRNSRQVLDEPYGPIQFYSKPVDSTSISETFSHSSSKKILMANEAYTHDFKIVKQGRFNTQILSNLKKKQPKLTSDLSSPKIIKQTRQVSRMRKNSRKKLNKDIIIVT